MMAKSLFKSLLAGLLLLWCLVADAANLSAFVDRTRLTLGETLTLSLRIDAAQPSQAPDISVLEPYFDTLSTGQSRQMRVVNGHAESFTQWDYALAPKREGRILIPAFRLEGATSEPLTVEVLPPREIRADSGDYFLELEVDRPRVYQGAQLLVTLRVNSAVRLEGLETEPFQLEGADVVPLGEQQFEQILKGRRYGVYEQRYAVFPSRSGTLEIPAQRAVAVQNAPRSLFDRRSGERIRLLSQSRTVEVLPPPQGQGGDWLPAAKLSLTQSFAEPAGGFRVGEPVTRILTLSAEGIDAARLPLLEPESAEGIRVYPEPAQTEENSGAGGLTVKRTRRFGLVPTQAGPLTLPALRIRWWDTEADRARVAELPEQVIQVQAAVAPPAPAPSPAPAPVAAPVPVPAAEPGVPGGWLLATNLAWAAVLLVVLGLWWRERRQRPQAPTTGSGLAAATVPSAEQAFARLEVACGDGDLARIRAALLAWARRHRDLAGVDSLEGLAEVVDDAALSAELRRLDRALFGAGGEERFDAQRVLASLKRWKPQSSGRPQNTPLAPLYP